MEVNFFQLVFGRYFLRYSNRGALINPASPSATFNLSIGFPILCLAALFFMLPYASWGQGYIAASTYLGGSNAEYNTKMCVLNGESYLIGQTGSSNFPVTLGGPFIGSGGNADIAVTKLAADGTILWSRYLGGNGNDYPTSFEVKNGLMFIAVNTFSADFPVTDGSSYSGAQNNFVFTVLDASTGAMQFSSYLGKGYPQDIVVEGGYAYLSGTKDLGVPLGFQFWLVKYDIGAGLIVYDKNYGGNSIEGVGEQVNSNKSLVVNNNTVYLVGVSYSTNFPVTDGSTLKGAYDHLYMKLNATTGDIEFATYFGGTTGTLNYGALDLRLDNGGVYLMGLTDDTDFPVTDGSTHKGQNDFYIRKYDAVTNNLIYSKLLGTSYLEIYATMEVQNGLVYLVGDLEASTGYPHTYLPGGYSGMSHCFYTKMNATTGNIVYSTWVHSNRTEYFYDAKVKDGNIYLLGLAFGTLPYNYPVTNGSVKASSGSDDIVFAKINTNNQICFATFLGGTNDDEGTSIAVENDFVYINGWTSSNNYPVTNSSTKKPLNDFIWTKFNLNPNLSVPSDNVSPATQTVCKNGFASLLVGDDIIFPSADMPLIYRNGVPSQQSAIVLKYQWQRATSPGGPWVNIGGAVGKDYSPKVGLIDLYYRRLTSASICSNSPISTSAVAAVLVNNNFAPTVNAGNVINTCSGNSVVLGGSPAATPNGGATIVSYSWTPAGAYTPGSTVANPSVSPTTNTIYSLLVTDNNGCEQVGQALVNVYAANAGPNKSNCAGQPVRIGSAPIAGLAGVTYAWSASPADPTMSCTNCAEPDVNPAVATTYTLTLTVPITGGGTCSTTSSVVVTPVAAPLTPNFAGPDRVICIGSTATLGTAAESGFNYVWAPGNYLTSNNASTTTFQPGNLSMPTPNPGLYYLTAIKGGCSFVDQVETAVIEARAGVDGCGPRVLGEADRTPGLNETYTWTKISGPGNFVGATNIPMPSVTASVGGATTYELTVSYTLNGVTQTCTDQVVVPDCGCVVDIKVEAPFACPSFGLNGGNVKLIATAADIFSSDPNVFTYTWSPNVGLTAYNVREVFLTDNVNRTYTVTMGSPFDPSFNCTQTIEVNHPAWSLPVFMAQDVTTCPGTSVSIGQPLVAGYDYKWTDTGNNLNAVNVSNPTATVNATTSFPVLVTDVGSGCTARDTATVTIEGFPANIAGDDVSFCGTVVVQLGKPAVPNVTYTWTPAASYNPNSSAANPTVTVSTSTTFTLTANNSVTGCSVTDNIVVTVKTPAPSFTLGNQTFCPSVAGAMPLPAGPAGMSSYSWSPASMVVNPTSNGPTATSLAVRPATTTTYTLQITNADGCQAQASTVFTPEVSNPVPGESRTICLGSSVQLGATPALPGTYAWTSSPNVNAQLNATNISNPIFTPTATGLVTFTVSKTDPGGCITTATVTINVVTFTLPPMSSPTVCENSCVQIGAIPTTLIGSQFFWSPTAGLSDPNIPNPIACVGSTSTTYTLTGVGANGCTATREVMVGVNPVPSPVVSVPTVNACLGDGGLSFSPLVSPAGSYLYEWSPSNGTLSNIYASNPAVYVTGVGTQTYTLTVTNPGTGCSGIATASLVVDFCPPAASGSAGNYVWFDTNGNGLQDEPTANGINGVTVELYDANTNTLLQSTTTANDGSGNPGYYNFVITQSGDYYVKFPTSNNGRTLTSQTATAVTDGNSDADATTGNTPVFAIDLNGTGAAKDNMTIDAGFRCDVAAPTASNNNRCGTGTVVLSASGCTGGTLSWWDASVGGNLLATGSAYTTPSISSTTNYFVDCTIGQCTSPTRTTVTATVHPAANSGITASDSICSTEPTLVQANNPQVGNTYTWSFGALATPSTSNNPNETVSYALAAIGTTQYINLTVQTAAGCSESYVDSIKVTLNPFADAGADTTTCQGYAVQLGAPVSGQTGSTYLWTPNLFLNNNTSANPIATPSGNITYTLTTTLNGCVRNAQVTVTVDVNLNPVADAGADRTVCIGTATTLGGSPTSSHPGSTYTWTPATGLNATNVANPIATLSSAATYQVIVTNTYGCTDTASVQVNVEGAKVGNYVWNDMNANGLQDEAATAGLNGITAALWSTGADGLIGGTGLNADVQISTTTTANDLNGDPGYYEFNVCATGNYYVKFPNTTGALVLTGQDPAYGTDGNSDADQNGNTPVFHMDLAGSGLANVNMTLDAGYMTCTQPVYASANGVSATCNGNDANQDAKIIVTGITNADRYDVSAGSTYVGNGYVTAMSLAGIVNDELRTNLPNGNGVQTYTVRLFGNSDLCYNDVVVTINPVSCGCADLYIDNFSTSKVYALQDGSGIAQSSFATGNGIGGELDIRHTVAPLGIDGDLVETFGDNNFMGLNIQHGVSTSGTITLQWDGVDGDATAINYTGLGGIDLTNNGQRKFIQFDLQSDFNTNDSVKITFALYSSATAASSVTKSYYNDLGSNINGIQIPLSAFTAFVGSGANLRNIGAIVMTIDLTARTGMDVFLQNLIMPCNPNARIGDFVWNDLDKDGVQEPGEPGISGVTVTLYDDLGRIVATTLTDAYGYYEFVVEPGTYTVGFGLPVDYVFSPKSVGSNNTDSDANPTTGKTDPITVVAGQTLTTVDAGMYFAEPVIQMLGDFVWFDTNNNGIQDNNEKGVSSITVTLYNGTTNQPIQTTLTNGDGYYFFRNLAVGDYYLGFSLPAGYVFTTKNAGTNTTDSDVFTSGSNFGRTAVTTLSTGEQDLTWDAGIVKAPVGTASVGDYLWNDRNQDGIQDADERGIPNVSVTLKDVNGNTLATTVTDEFGYYVFNGLPAGTYYITFDVPTGYTVSPRNASGEDDRDSDIDPSGNSMLFTLAANEIRTDIDAGMYLTTPAGTAALGDYVWYDDNQNGVQDATEAGVAGVTVTLYNGTGTALRTTTTNQNGLYLFANLAAGTYSVGFSNLPDNYGFTPAGLGTAATGSDADDSGRTANVTLSNGQTNLDLDAGIIIKAGNSGKASIGDYVWLDRNGNGLQDGNESGVGNVTVNLLDATTLAILQTTTTAPNGYYMFTGLEAGNYIVEFTSLPLNHSFTTANVGTHDNIDSDANASTGRTGVITLVQGQNRTDVDAGLQTTTGTGSIGDFVWLDSNADGLQDAGEPGVPGVGVLLYDNQGRLISATTTNSDGYYYFGGLPAGDYQVRFANIPTGMSYTTQTVNTANGSDVNPGTGSTPYFPLANGENRTDIDAGLISIRGLIGNYVWLDDNKDGIQDAGEEAVSGVTVSLYNSSNVAVASAITNAKGEYYFPNVIPGAGYTIGFATTPAGTSFTLKDAGANDVDSDVTPATGLTDAFNVAVGELNLTYDAGLINPPKGSLNGYVWFDEDKDGVQDAGELPTAGVTVILYDATGTVVIATTVTDASGNYYFNDLPPGTYLVGFTTLPVDANGVPYTFTQADQGGDDTLDSDANPLTGISLVSYTITDGERKEAADAGLIRQTASIGDKVWLDQNENGEQDAGEPGVAGITVILYDNSGNIVRTTLTDTYGEYLFNDVPPGTYTVGFSLPIDYVFTLQGTGTTTDSDPNPTTGRTNSITVAAGDNRRDIDAGIFFQNSNDDGLIGDYVWFDANTNGLQDNNEKGVSNVTVTLYDGSGNVLAATLTNADGYYSFRNVTAGNDYQVGFTLPTGYTFSPANQGGNDATDSDVNTAGINFGKTDVFTLNPSGRDLTLDAGIVLAADTTASVGDYVWHDLNQNGLQEAGEPGIPGIEVNLLTATGTLVSRTTTDDFGRYVFTNVPEGRYRIEIIAPTGWTVSAADQGADDDTDSDINPSTGLTDIFFLAQGDNQMQWDGGMYQTTPPGSASLGDYVWFDADFDGQQDATEYGVGGLTVTLFDGSTAIGRTTTNSEGYYLFVNLPAGNNYRVEFSNLPDGMIFTTVNQGADATDSDANPANGFSHLITLVSGQHDPSVDAGLVPDDTKSGKGSLGDYVWYDLNNNGIQDAGEQGVVGVRAILTKLSNNAKDTTWTDTRGYYIFNDLDEGNYTVAFDNLPAGYGIVAQNQGADISKDSDVNPATAVTGTIILGNGESNMTIDMGIFNPAANAALGDKVWNDLNQNGLQDVGEPGVAGVAVTLYDATGIAVRMMVTDDQGGYLFTGLTAGVYSVGFSNLPAGFRLTRMDAGNDDNLDSDANPSNGRTTPVNLLANTTDLSLDAGIFSNTRAAIGNYVWFDTDADGAQDVAEKGVGGVTVWLLDAGGTPVGSRVTDADGFYYFNNMLPGTYSLFFSTIPENTSFTLQKATLIGLDSDPDATGLTTDFTVVAGEVNYTYDAGLIAPIVGALTGYVWYDYINMIAPTNANGIQNAGEKPVSGVTVQLLDLLGSVLATTVTNPDGLYFFDNLTPGDYQINFIKPAGTKITLQDQGGDDTIDSDANPATGFGGTYTVVAGQRREAADMGLVPPANISGFVFTDGCANQQNTANGIYDDNGGLCTDAPIPGVNIVLVDENGTIIRRTRTTDPGTYIFRNVEIGQNYKVAFEPNPQYCALCEFTTANAMAGNDSTDSDAYADTTIVSGAKMYAMSHWIVDLLPLETRPDIDAGYMLPGAAFPIELLYFTAELHGKDGVLDWKTNLEVNSAHFAVERSLDNGSSFEQIGTVKAAGNSDLPIQYTYIDPNVTRLAKQTIYYRLKMVDLDGTYKRSNVVQLKLLDNINPIYVNAYPNPATDQINVDYQLYGMNWADLRIVNTLGQVVHNQQLKTAGQVQTTQIDVSNWASGVYYIQISNEQNQTTVKFVKE